MTNTAHMQARAFLRALNFAAKPIEGRNTIPVLAMAAIRFDGQQATISGTDLDMVATATLDLIEGPAEPFAVVLRPAILANLARYATDTISFSREGSLVTIIADDVEAVLRETCQIEDVPILKPYPFATVETISADLLRRAIHATKPCISDEETRYYLNGLFLAQRENCLTIVSTDGHRLARYETGAAWGLPDAILPKKSANIIYGQINPASNGQIKVTAYSTNKPDPLDRSVIQLEFRGDDWALYTKMIDGTFPDYNRVIPKFDSTLRATINMAAIRRFPSLCGDMSQALKFDLDKARLSITAPDADETISMPLLGSGTGTFGFNLKYVKDFARRADEILIEGASANDPFRVLTSDPCLLQVLMPMQV